MRNALGLTVATALAAAGAVSGAGSAAAAPAHPLINQCHYSSSDRPIVVVGESGPEVAQLQCELNVANARYHFYPRQIVVDGVVGVSTVHMLEAYKKYFGHYPWEKAPAGW